MFSMTCLCDPPVPVAGPSPCVEDEPGDPPCYSVAFGVVVRSEVVAGGWSENIC